MPTSCPDAAIRRPAASPQHSGMMPGCTLDTCTASQARDHYLDQRYDLSAASEPWPAARWWPVEGLCKCRSRNAALSSHLGRGSDPSAARAGRFPKLPVASRQRRLHCRHWLPLRAHFPCPCFPVALQPVAGAARAVPG